MAALRKLCLHQWRHVLAVLEVLVPINGTDRDHRHGRAQTARKSGHALQNADGAQAVRLRLNI